MKIEKVYYKGNVELEGLNWQLGLSFAELEARRLLVKIWNEEKKVWDYQGKNQFPYRLVFKSGWLCEIWFNSTNPLFYPVFESLLGTSIDHKLHLEKKYPRVSRSELKQGDFIYVIYADDLVSMMALLRL